MKKCFILRFPAESADLDEFFDDGDDLQTERLPDGVAESDDKDASQKASKSIATRRKINFIDARIVAALDKSAISSTSAVHIVTAVAAALGHRIQDLVVSRNSIDRCRVKYREEIARLIQDDFHATVI